MNISSLKFLSLLIYKFAAGGFAKPNVREARTVRTVTRTVRMCEQENQPTRGAPSHVMKRLLEGLRIGGKATTFRTIHPSMSQSKH